MLPLDDADAFVERLTAFAPDVLVTQHFHDSGGGFGADTGPAARQLLAERRWTAEDYRPRRGDVADAASRCMRGRRGFFRHPDPNGTLFRQANKSATCD